MKVHTELAGALGVMFALVIHAFMAPPAAYRPCQCCTKESPQQKCPCGNHCHCKNLCDCTKSPE